MKTTALLIPFLFLAACGDSASNNKTTTKLDAVEVQPGTISDSMIILDDSNSDGTAVDNSIPVDPNAKKESKPDGDAADTRDDEAASDDSDTVTGPANKTAEPKLD